MRDKFYQIRQSIIVYISSHPYRFLFLLPFKRTLWRCSQIVLVLYKTLRSIEMIHFSPKNTKPIQFCCVNVTYGSAHTRKPFVCFFVSICAHLIFFYIEVLFNNRIYCALQTETVKDEPFLNFFALWWPIKGWQDIDFF